MHWKSLLVGGLLTYCLTSIVLKETIIAFLPRVSPLLGTVLSLIVFIWVLGAGPLLGGYVAGRCAARGLVAHAAGAGTVGAAAYLALYWQEISPAWLAWSLLPWACGLAGGGGRLAVARRARIDRT